MQNESMKKDLQTENEMIHFFFKLFCFFFDFTIFFLFFFFSFYLRYTSREQINALKQKAFYIIVKLTKNQIAFYNNKM